MGEVPQKHIADVVTIERFNACQAVWGPFFIKEDATRVLEEMRRVIEHKWYHGLVSRRTAEERLKVEHRAPGVFLVRMSVSQANVPFVISYVGPAKGDRKASIHHLKIERPDWKKATLVMDGEKFDSLVDC